MFLTKYRSEVLGFGSKRDFEASRYYIENALFPILTAKAIHREFKEMETVLEQARE